MKTKIKELYGKGKKAFTSPEFKGNLEEMKKGYKGSRKKYKRGKVEKTLSGIKYEIDKGFGF